jgi:hypothetical protein
MAAVLWASDGGGAAGKRGGAKMLEVDAVRAVASSLGRCSSAGIRAFAGRPGAGAAAAAAGADAEAWRCPCWRGERGGWHSAHTRGAWGAAA